MQRSQAYRYYKEMSRSVMAGAKEQIKNGTDATFYVNFPVPSENEGFVLRQMNTTFTNLPVGIFVFLDERYADTVGIQGSCGDERIELAFYMPSDVTVLSILQESLSGIYHELIHHYQLQSPDVEGFGTDTPLNTLKSVLAYLTHPTEIEAFSREAYLRAKKQRRAFSQVANKMISDVIHPYTQKFHVRNVEKLKQKALAAWMDFARKELPAAI